jgi:hypothetical protein
MAKSDPMLRSCFLKSSTDSRRNLECARKTRNGSCVLPEMIPKSPTDLARKQCVFGDPNFVAEK